MIIMLFNITIKDDAQIETFKMATVKNSIATNQEAGCISFELLQSNENPNQFTMIEKYQDQTALDAHFASAHFQAWREATSEVDADYAGGQMTLLDS